MKNWKSILGVLLIFLLGALTGGLIVGAIAKRGAEQVLNGNGSLLSDAIAHRLSHELDLTDDQKAKLQAIVTEAQGKIRAVRAEAQPKVKDALETSANEIRAILTPAQRIKFEIIARRGRERLEKLGG